MGKLAVLGGALALAAGTAHAEMPEGCLLPDSANEAFAIIEEMGGEMLADYTDEEAQAAADYLMSADAAPSLILPEDGTVERVVIIRIPGELVERNDDQIVVQFYDYDTCGVLSRPVHDTAADEVENLYNLSNA